MPLGIDLAVVKTVLDPILGLANSESPFQASYFSGWIESDVHWGYVLALDPWPFVGFPGGHLAL